tara:strand:+ start:1136 stop:1534 length:399 start_codon:yes stop_codon:yes gene_type:complete
MKNQIKKQNKGFTLVEIMVVVVIIGILATMVGGHIGSLSDVASSKVKKANAQSINHMLSTIYAVGGDIGDGRTIDTSSSETLINSLTKNPPLEIDEITFSLDPKPNYLAYELVTGEKPYKILKPIKGSKEKP